MGIAFAVIYGAFTFATWGKGVQAYVAGLPYATFAWGPATILILIATGFAYRKQNNLAFVDALRFAFLAYVIYEVGYALVNVVIYNFIDKGFNHTMTLASLQKDLTDSMKRGLPLDDINKSIADENAHPSGPFTAIQVLLGLGQGLIWSFMKAMFVALVIRKQPKQPMQQAEQSPKRPAENQENPQNP